MTLVLLWLFLGQHPVQPKVVPQVTREYPSYCYDRSRDFYLPCMYSSKEYRA